MPDTNDETTMSVISDNITTPPADKAGAPATAANDKSESPNGKMVKTKSQY